MTKVGTGLNENSITTKIKNQFFLRKIGENINRNKLLEYIRYNKEIQNTLGININDYIDEYLKIVLEIELIPTENKYIKFINIKKENLSHFHFNFDDNPQEIKNNIINKNDRVKKVKIIIDKNFDSFECLFEQRLSIKKINFLRFNRKDIKNMRNIFAGCSSLEEINLTHFNTDNVSNMSQMFHGCSSLKEINLSNFNTEKVTNMSYMFDECSSLKKINLISFNTNNVTNMRGMFRRCSSLEQLDLSNFATDKVNDMCQMFQKCSSLKEINLSNLNTNVVENMCEMFQECSSLKELNLSNFKTNNLILMNFMFGDCSSLEKLYISNFDSKNMFIINCRLNQCNCPIFLTNTVEPIKYMLKMCSFSMAMNMIGFNIYNIIGMSNIFDGCFSLKELNCSDEFIKNEYKKFKLANV